MKFSVSRCSAFLPGRLTRAASCLLLTVAAAPAQSVVVNKYQNIATATLPNPGGDNIELLVTGGGVSGSTVDMRRMLLKDHSSSMGSDGGGKYRFNDIAFFSTVKAGTLIVITDGSTSADTDAVDFVLRLGLRDTTYFTKEGISTSFLDIAATEMVMIKGQDAPVDGGTGAIHTLAGGIEGGQYTSAPGKKMRATSGSSIPTGVIASNSTSSLADYDGSDAAGAVASATLIFGAPNNATNNTFIQSLRTGVVTPDGAGAATITNTTAGSPFVDKNIFPRNTPAQTVAISLVSSLPAGSEAITSVKVTVPATMGAPVEANVAVAGIGAGTPVITVSGQDITITGVSITLTTPAVITLSDLTTPNPTAIADDGRYPFTVQTAGDAGVLTSIAIPPAALVQIPVANLRDVDANKVPLDNNKTVAISAVCTEENFNATGTSAYVQDGDFGINIFIAGTDLALTRGMRYAITGQILQFNGLTEISPSSAAGVIALGPDTQPAPLTVSVSALLANAEAYEGRLVKVLGLNYAGGNWGTSPTVGTTDASANPLDIRIQPGSNALTPPSWPASITGIFGQFDNNSPFDSGYQLMPRTDADVESSGGGAGYDGWASAFPDIGGPSDDGDSDGSSNFLEYAGGSIPNDGSSMPQNAQTLIGNTLTVAWAKGTPASTDPKLAWSIEVSTSMAADSWSTAEVVNLENGPASISGDYIIQPGASKAFLRLKVVHTP